jgi:hypothetical protein
MELRDEIAEIVVAIQVDACASGPEHAEHPEEYTDQILTLFNKPLEVEVECDKCGGLEEICEVDIRCRESLPEYVETCPYTKAPAHCYNNIIPCPHCKDGKVKRRIVWGNNEGTDAFSRPLTLPDLLDPDVLEACGILMFKWKQGEDYHVGIDNNKGVLRLEDA